MESQAVVLMRDVHHLVVNQVLRKKNIYSIEYQY